MHECLERGPVGRAAVVVSVMLGVAGPARAEAPGSWRWEAEGRQVYRCVTEGDRPGWTLVGPDATLRDAGGVVRATHAAGPIWTAGDGSLIQAAPIQAIPAPDKGSVPWLMLRVSRHEGAGVMAPVAYVLRTETQGGAAPSGRCTGTELLGVPYRATYTFVAGDAPP